MILSKLRKYKWAYSFYNFFHKKSLVHNIPHYKRLGINKKYYSSISLNDFKDLESPINLFDQYDSADLLQKKDFFKSLSKNKQKSLTQWSKDGYVILKSYFDEKQINSVNKQIDVLINNGKVQWGYHDKIMFAFRQSEAIKSCANNTELLGILKLLMNKDMSLFQSINFLKGSQQKAHSDFIHMTTFPYGNIIAVWVALEDITNDSGPLHYYPGSHKLPYVTNKDFDNIGSRFKLGKSNYSDYENHIEKIIQAEKLKKKVFLAKKGDVFIWHANLLHGGDPVTNVQSSRKSMVFHYYSNDSVCFHEITERPALRP